MNFEPVNLKRGIAMGIAVILMIVSVSAIGTVRASAKTFEEMDFFAEVGESIEEGKDKFDLEIPEKSVLELEQSESADAQWEDKAMADVDDKVNVRAQADVTSEIAGALRKGDLATVVEKGTEWTLITSGNLEGYISNEYLVFGNDAKELAEEEGKWIAVVNTQTLRLRDEASEESAVTGLAAEGQELTINTEADTVEGWTAVIFENETSYVSNEFVEKELVVSTGLTSEELNAQEEAAVGNDASDDADDDDDDSQSQSAQSSDNDAQTSSSSDTQSNDGGSNTAVVETVEEDDTPAPTQTVSASSDTVTLLAAIIMCEAGGEPYEGQLAVGSVIMNRVNSPQFPNTISEVVYQSGQFSPVANGRLASTLASGNITDSCYQAANAVLAGTNNMSGCLFFQATYLGHSGYVIGGHVFY